MTSSAIAELDRPSRVACSDLLDGFINSRDDDRNSKWNLKLGKQAKATVVNLKTSSRTIAPVAVENINMKLRLKATQIRDVRPDCIPKCHDVLMKRPISVNWSFIVPR